VKGASRDLAFILEGKYMSFTSRLEEVWKIESVSQVSDLSNLIDGFKYLW
jgi:hypothetical protein